MNAKIWRVLAQILYDRNELKETIQPFFENLKGRNINDDQCFPILKTFSKDQLAVLYKSGIITEEKFVPKNIISTQSNITKIVEEIITGDKLDELQKLIKENDIMTFNTIIAPFKEVEKMSIPIIQYCVMKNAMKCFKYLLVNGYDHPTKAMEEQNPNTKDRYWKNQHRYEWDCMATTIYFGQIEMMTILEEKGIEKGKNAAHFEAAILSYRNEICKEMIEGLNENKENVFSRGLLTASKNNNIYGAEILIKNGVNINAKDAQSHSLEITKPHFIGKQRKIQKR